jgi:hypothetical protein
LRGTARIVIAGHGDTQYSGAHADCSLYQIRRAGQRDSVMVVLDLQGTAFFRLYAKLPSNVSHQRRDSRCYQSRHARKTSRQCRPTSADIEGSNSARNADMERKTGIHDMAIRFLHIRISREGSTTLQSLATHTRAENRRLFERGTGATPAGRACLESRHAREEGCRRSDWSSASVGRARPRATMALGEVLGHGTQRRHNFLSD